MEQNKTTERSQWSGRWKLLAVVFVCAAPMLFSYLTYYVIKPTGRTNYGTLIEPQKHPIPAALGATTLDGKPIGLDAYKGKWIMLQSGPGACPQECIEQLVAMRQWRLMQGKEMERIERVWLVTDATPIETMLIRMVDGTRMLRVPAASLEAWLPVEPGGKISDHTYVIDPMGHLMMRFPKKPDPSKVKKDMYKLLKASAIG